MNQYDPKSLEPKWQKVWADTNLYTAVNGDQRPKYYMLTEFPYPSAAGMHAGNAREYTLGDVMARHKRMLGYNVLYPMGWDAFGLPAENYAIKNKIHPSISVAQNVASFRSQMQSLGLSFDWSREINTSDPDYYKWTQWLFLQFFKHGLAYQDEIAINWCPFEKTGLANEEVVNGLHERCGTPVEKKLLKQWMLAITKYADRLIDGLKTVDYPPRIADQQINWIGRSEGAEIDFAAAHEKITVYTTRPDTLAGATFLVLAPEHPAVAKITTPAQKAAVDKYVKQAQSETELNRQDENRPKTGVATGAYTENPITREKMAVWIADYVLAGYGTGAIMAVPAHDERDFAFAKAFGLPVKSVVEPVSGLIREDSFEKEAIVAVVSDPKTGRVLMLDWGPRQADWGGMLFVGGGVEAGETDLVAVAKREIAEETGYTDVELIKKSDIRVHNYYFSNPKRRYDLAHITPLLFELKSDKQSPTAMDENEKGLFKSVWVDEDQVARTVDGGHEMVYGLLMGEYLFTGTGPLVNSGRFDGLSGDAAKHAIVEWLFKAGLGRHATKYRLRDWIFSRQHYWGEPIPIIHCPKCGAVPVPDDQLPVKLPEVEHYEPTETGESPLATIESWVNVDCPKCARPAKRETDTMPNWAGSSWYYLRYMDPHNTEAFAAPANLKYWGEVDLYLGGMEHTTLHLLYSRFWHEFFYDQKLVPTPEPYAARRGQGIVLAADGRKMSKSLGNVINPADIVARYSADAFRLYIMFMAPYDETTPWSDERLNGVSRFLYRVWNLAANLRGYGQGPQNLPDQAMIMPVGEFTLEVDRMAHKTLKKVHDDLGAMRFNTIVSTLMEYVNFLNDPKRSVNFAIGANRELAVRSLRVLILMLAPAAPHIAEQLWHELGEEGSVHAAAWPAYDPSLIKDDLATIVVQVNGKVRATLLAPVDITEADLINLASIEPKVAAALAGQKIANTIVVPRRLVNFVVKEG